MHYETLKNHNMKKLALSIMAIAITFASIAQKNNKGGKHKNHKEKTENEARHNDDYKAEKLDLNDAQKVKVKAQNEQFKKQMEELKASNLSDEQKKVRRKEILEARRQQMASILTPEQKLKARKIKKEKNDKKDIGIKNREIRKEKVEKLKEDVALTNNQSAQLKALNESFRTKVKAVQSNATLTGEQKKEQRQALQLKHKEDIRSLLTTEQKDRMKNRPNRKSVK